MSKLRSRHGLVLGTLQAVAVLLLVCSCTSDRESRRGGPPDEAAAAAIPEMEAHGTFFAGKLLVDVVLNRGGFRRHAGEDDSAGRGASESRGGFRGGFGGMGGGGRRGNRGGGEESGGRGGSRDEEEPRAHITASHQPPVSLHLRLSNRSADAATVTVPDFNSALGNFVVQPERLTVPANGSIEADPMNSQLGVPADEIPLTVTLVADGEKETQVLTLRIKPEPAPPAP